MAEERETCVASRASCVSAISVYASNKSQIPFCAACAAEEESPEAAAGGNCKPADEDAEGAPTKVHYKARVNASVRVRERTRVRVYVRDVRKGE